MRIHRRSTSESGTVELLTIIAMIVVLAVLGSMVVAAFQRTADEESGAAKPSSTEKVINESATTNDAKSEIDDALTDPKIVVLFAGACLGLLAFAYKQLVSQVAIRAEFSVLEELSRSNEAQSRKALAGKVKKFLRSWVWWIPGSFTDGLANLVSKDKIIVTNGNYRLPGNQKQSEDNKRLEINLRPGEELRVQVDSGTVSISRPPAQVADDSA